MNGAGESMNNIQVGIIMGSATDMPIMAESAQVLEELAVSFEIRILSAHRTPDRLFEYAASARERGIKVIIAGAGGAAHLPGVTAAMTTLPVIGVPVKSSLSLDGWDSILSMLQMPAGIPVATVALNGARNAGILAARILGVSDGAMAERLKKFHESMAAKVVDSDQEIQKKGFRPFLK